MSTDDGLSTDEAREDALIGQMDYAAEEDAFAQTNVVSLDALNPDLNDDIGVTDPMIAAEEGEPYFPPTDPVIVPESNFDGGARVVGGLAAASDDAIRLNAEGLDETVAWTDDEITDAVRAELASDALTLDLDIDILVVNGVVTLRGTVATMQDAEAAETVASRVPGVEEVQEELTVAGM